MATGNPIAIASATAWVAKATAQEIQATKEYNRAKKNRINMQKRVEIVKKAKFNTEKLISESQNIFNLNLSNITFQQQSVNMRLQKAYQALDGYFSNESYLKDLNIIKPNNLRDIFKLNDNKTKEYFDYFYASNEKFRNQVNKLKFQYYQAKTSFEKEKVLRQIRRNLVGDFAEKYIEKSLSSLGDVKTQHIEKMKDSFSKVDIRLENVKKPIILGKGDCGKFIKEGGTLSIEIKTGQKEYLKSQKEHLIFQTQAHKKSSDASMILTTKDIYDLQDEEGFREIFKDDCVSIIAGLPYKQELDQWVINSMELGNGKTKNNR